MSSLIAAFEYDEKLEVLDITFRSGKTRRYFNVGSQIHSGLAGAESKGKYFNKYIRNNYVSNYVEK